MVNTRFSFINSEKILIVLLILPFTAKPQKDTARLSVGLDLLRSLPIYYDAGYTIEPSILLRIKNNVTFEAAFGVSEIAVKPIYNNIDYRSSGNYFRTGVRLPFGGRPNFSVGLCLGFTNFVEVGKTIFKGNYFGDFTYEKSQQNRLFFLEPSLNYRHTIYRRLSFAMQLKLPLVLSTYNTESFPVYSAPGIGFLRFLASDADAKSNRGVLGLSVRLLYNLF
jgi:hypothetical protein